MSLESWEYTLVAALIVSFVGVFVSALTLIWGLVGEYKDPHSSTMVEVGARKLKMFPLLVIVGVAGELFFNTTSFVSSITLEVLHSTAEQQAKKETAQIKERAEALEKSNLELRKDLANTQQQLDATKLALQREIEKQRGRLSADEAKDQPLVIDDDKFRRVMRRLPKSLRTVTLMTLADPVAGPSADHIRAALQSLKPRFKVSIVKLAASQFRGIIVCQRSADDVKVGNALKNAGIVSEIKPMAIAPECKQIQLATYEDGGRGFLFNADPRVDGTFVFVGHR